MCKFSSGCGSSSTMNCKNCGCNLCKQCHRSLKTGNPPPSGNSAQCPECKKNFKWSLPFIFLLNTYLSHNLHTLNFIWFFPDYEQNYHSKMMMNISIIFSLNSEEITKFQTFISQKLNAKDLIQIINNNIIEFQSRMRLLNPSYIYLEHIPLFP